MISTAIDSLDNNNKLHIGIIVANSIYICLAQKNIYGGYEYAVGLVFGYGTDKLFYQRKDSGSWLTVREI